MVVEPFQGGHFRFELDLDSIPTVELLHRITGHGEDMTVPTRNDLEQHLVGIHLRRHHEPNALTDLESSDTQAVQQSLVNRGLQEENVRRAIQRFTRARDAEEIHNEEDDTAATAGERETAAPASGTLGRSDSEASWTESMWPERNVRARNGHNLKSMLYYIAEEQARQDGYVHRGVTCNSCDMKPIRGIRWHCANCPDYDLCSDCEATNMHPKTHVFYKVKIPAPFLGIPRQTQPIIYPGDPLLMPTTLTLTAKKRLMDGTRIEAPQLEALWDQFTCLANCRWPEDPDKLGGAIDRRSFDKTFVPHTTTSPRSSNLICDRLFAFFDTNGDGLIGFEEFVKGLSQLRHGPKLCHVFKGYDIDGDGFITRKDFLRMFRAYYAIQKEITRDVLSAQEDDLNLSGALDMIRSSQPLSAGFTDIIPPGERTVPTGKALDEFGDAFDRNPSVVLEDEEDVADRNEVIVELANLPRIVRSPQRIRRQTRWQEHLDSDNGSERDALEDMPDHGTTDESPQSNEQFGTAVEGPENNVLNAIERESEQENLDAARAVSPSLEESVSSGESDGDGNHAVIARWEKRQFYVDEEEGFAPPDGFQETESCEQNGAASMPGPEPDEQRPTPPSRTLSPRSRSSSKVRFQDDPEIETRSNASTSSRPVGERWGGYEVAEADKDVAREVLYQVTQQALNDILDLLFLEKENLAMEVYATKELRKFIRPKIEELWAAKGLSKHTDERVSRDILMWKAADADGVKMPLDSTLNVQFNGSPTEGSEVSMTTLFEQWETRHADRVNGPQAEDASIKQAEDAVEGSARGLSDDVNRSVLLTPLEQVLAELLPESADTQSSPLTSPVLVPTQPSTEPPLGATTTSASEQRGHSGHNEMLSMEAAATILCSIKSELLDPTLPQNRPNNEAHEAFLRKRVQGFTQHQAPVNSSATSGSTEPDIPGHSVSQDTGVDQLGQDATHQGTSHAKADDTRASETSDVSAIPFIPASFNPSEALLLRLGLLDAEEREMKRRGGGGRLDSVEFEVLLRTGRGRGLGFLEGWFELVSF